MYKNILQILKDQRFINSNGKISPHLTRKIDESLKLQIIQLTSFIEYDITLSDRIRIMMLNITEQPRCICGNPTKFYKTLKLFVDHCCKRCSDLNPDVISKRIASYDAVRAEATEKRKKTNLERYGVEHYLSFPGIVEQTKQTKMERYGDPNYCNVEQIQQTNLERYGRLSGYDAEKARNTFFEKYGVSHPMQCNHIKNKVIVTRCGFLIDEYDYDEKTRYKRSVIRETRRWDLMLIENYEKQGRLDLNEDAYHLDHIISLEFGFHNNIPPEHIGHICNLRFIPARDNIIKSGKCDMSYDELVEKIKNFST